MTIEHCLSLAESRGLLSLNTSQRREYGDCLEVGAFPLHGWDILAGWLSACLGLTVWAGSGGVTGVSGATVWFRIVASQNWDSATEARTIAEEVTGESFPTSQGAIARRLWERIGNPQYCDESQINLIDAPGGFYIKSIPGVYKTVFQYDLSNAYGSIIARLPSPYVKAFSDGGLSFKRHKSMNYDAWIQLQLCSNRSKHIGRALYGTALGASKRQRRWHKGDKMMHHLAPGAFRPLGHLTARIVYELSFLASQSENVVHAYTDCVSTQDDSGSVPVWDMAGAEYKLKASGTCDIINPSTYMVGGDMTEVYKAVKGLPTVNKYEPAPAEVAVKLVRGDSPVPQLFSSFLLVNGG